MKKWSAFQFCLKCKKILFMRIIHVFSLISILATVSIFISSCFRNPEKETSFSEPLNIETVHPRYLEIPVPSGGIEVQTNPPVLRWPYEKGSKVFYEVELSQDSLFPENGKTFVKTEMAVYNPHRKMENGTWFWRYRKVGGDFSKLLEFTVDNSAVEMVSPSATDFLQSVPAVHPRVLIQKSETNELLNLIKNPDAQAIVAEAKKYLEMAVPSENDAFSKSKSDDPRQQRKFDMDASQKLSSTVYHGINLLSQAYLLTGKTEFSEKAIALAMEVTAWNPEGITRLSDFGDARCMLGMALVYDTFYDKLTDAQKQKLLQAASKRAGYFYGKWVNDIESKILSGHVWQHILHYFFQTAVALHGDEPAATDWLTYAYELFLARAPVLAGFDGGFTEGVSYFRMNMETLIDIPLFIKKFSGFDFINSHPWYTENIDWMIWHIPPGSSADGFADNTEEVFSPGAEYIAFAEEMAKLTGNQRAAWYAAECKKYETPDLSKTELLRWIRLTKTRNLPMPEITEEQEFPMGAVFKEVGLAAIHSNLKNTTNDLMVAFKSSPLGSYGHMLCDQNTFNILYGGKRLFYRTGYKVTMDDPHRTGWYRTTKSQNGILINGEGQTYSSDAFGWISRFLQGNEIAYVKGDATNAYKNEAQLHNVGVRKVLRHIVMLKPDLIIVYDELESEEDSHWSWLIHSMQKMKTDSENGIFTVSPENVRGAGKLFSSSEVRWALADTFEVPAVNWRQSRHPDGSLKTYDDPQWHLKVSTLQKMPEMRFLAIIQVSPNSDLDEILRNSKPDNNGNVDVTLGDWNISACLDIKLAPSLSIKKADGSAGFSAYSNELNVFGKKIKANKENGSLLFEERNGELKVFETVDELPWAMRNAILFQKK